MGKVFSYDSPVWKFMGRLVDFFVLTVLWAVTSIPIVTMGTATTTVYYITLKMTKNQDGYIFSTYFKTFGRLFLETTKAWLLALIVGVALGGDIYICLNIGSAVASMLLAALFVVTLVYIMTLMYLFPVMARLDNTIMGYIKASFYLAVKNFGWSILLFVVPVCYILIGVFKLWPLLIISVGLIAYLQSLIYNQIFKVQGWDID
jgi:uncharacterized membrane protein YesL